MKRSTPDPAPDSFDGALPDMSETVLCSVVSDDFAAGFIVMERSLRHHNPDWHFPIIAVQSSLKPLSEEVKAIISAHCLNVHFATTDELAMAPIYDYARDVIGTPERLFPAFALLEIMRWKFFKRVIAIDSDVIVRGSLEPLLYCSAPLSASRATNPSNNALMSFVNTGVIVLYPGQLSGFEFHRIRSKLGNRIPRLGTGKADQAVINTLIPNRSLGYIPGAFNYTKRALYLDMIDQGYLDPTPQDLESFLDCKDIRILHFVGEKPWNPKVRQREKRYVAAEALWRHAVEFYARSTLSELISVQGYKWQMRYDESVKRLQGETPGADFDLELKVVADMGL